MSVGYASRQSQYKAMRLELNLCWLSLVCVGLRDRGRFQLFLSQALFISPWLAVCGRESVLRFLNAKAGHGGFLQDALHVAYSLEHVLTFIVLIG